MRKRVPKGFDLIIAKSTVIELDLRQRIMYNCLDAIGFCLVEEIRQE